MQKHSVSGKKVFSRSGQEKLQRAKVVYDRKKVDSSVQRVTLQNTAKNTQKLNVSGTEMIFTF